MQQPPDRIRQLLHHLRWSQADFARECGFSPSFISAILKGQRPASQAVLHVIERLEQQAGLDVAEELHHRIAVDERSVEVDEAEVELAAVALHEAAARLEEASGTLRELRRLAGLVGVSKDLHAAMLRILSIDRGGTLQKEAALVLELLADRQEMVVGGG